MTDTARRQFRDAARGTGRAGTAELPDGPYMSMEDAARIHAILVEELSPAVTPEVQSLLDFRTLVRDRVSAVSGYGGDGDIPDDDKLVDVVSDLAHDQATASRRLDEIMTALRPFARAFNEADGDTLGMAIPDRQIFFTGQSSWGPDVRVTYGEIRALVGLANQYSQERQK